MSAPAAFVPREAGRTLGMTGLVLGYGLASQRWLTQRASVPANLVASAGLLLVARQWGASCADLGARPADVGRGVGVGLAVVPPIAAVLATGARLPATRRYFVDERAARVDGREIGYELVVRIPLGTALSEEVMFRGALLGIASAWLGPTAASLYCSLVFGAWHVLPALEAHRHNPAAAALADRAGGRVATVLATVAATTVAGLALCKLRFSARSLVAPVLAHTALNGVAFGLAWATRGTQSSVGAR
jgi:membrane protease YdiL (CAAX protease family)